MEKIESKHFRFGLVGKNISYSFSRGYFSQKFLDLNLPDHSYENFDLPQIDDFAQLLKINKNIKGLNVTIPYKQSIIPFLDDLDSKAEKIGAVNTIKIHNNSLKGYNTDIYGFESSLKPFLKPYHKKALILGTGGASKAVAYVFEELDIPFKFVSRTPDDNELSYDELSKKIMDNYKIIINCTPLGTYPAIDVKPEIPYSFVTKNHFLFDLIYNPERTTFLKEGEKHGATVCNGLKMLEQQAEKAWEIWNS